MEVGEHEQLISAIIRRTRRQLNLTQTQLGGTEYSKSYVSALERGKLIPSHRALQFFAAQLALPEDYLTKLVEQAEHEQSLTMSPASLHENESYLASEEGHMLDVLLEHSYRYSTQALHELPSFALEQLTTTTSSRRAGYAFLLGMSAQKKGEYATAVRSLEYALALAPRQQQPAILDALGYTCFLQNAPAIALHYHLRAHRLLEGEDRDEIPSSLLLNVALHCGNDYQSLGAYRQASAMYEEARAHLTAEQDMQTAANLYLGLGYCLYGLVCQHMHPASAQEQSLSGEEREQLFQRAITLLLQSQSIFQVSGDSRGESSTRLTLALVELDLSVEQHRRMGQQTHSAKMLLEARSASLLDDVEAQCHQVLLRYQEEALATNTALNAQGHLVYMALASLVRVHIQRSILARVKSQEETALRERILATSLCQEALANVGMPAFPPERISQLLAIRTAPFISRDPTLPCMPDVQVDRHKEANAPRGWVELYLAGGEVAEELGRATVNQSFAHDCYARADTFYHIALEQACAVVAQHEQDSGYAIHCYQRCIALLRERVSVCAGSEEQTVRTTLDLLEHELSYLPGLLVSPV